MANLATMLIGLERFTSGLKRHTVQVGDHRIVYSEGGHGEPGVPSKPGFGLLGWKPVKRRLVGEQWEWSSFRSYLYQRLDWCG